MDKRKKALFEAVAARKDRIIETADAIFDLKEIGLQEYRSSALLISWLEEEGFTVERGTAGIETAFRAVYGCGQGGPVLGLLCEYDALEGIGHACGHHMQGPSIIAAAAALKHELKDQSYQIVVYGTPAEETVSSKVDMARKGCFRELDVALMMHANPTTCVDVKSMAIATFDVTFHGIGGHAAFQPHKTRSALDAIQLMNLGIEFMREHVIEDTRMHYTILDAGGPANATPATAKARVLLRSYNTMYLQKLIIRFKNIVQGAALMTGTTFEIECVKQVKGKIPSYKLNDLVMENAREAEAPKLRGPREKTGSTDFAEVMSLVPGTCIRIAFVEEGTSSHSAEYLAAGKTADAHLAEVKAAQILAGTCYDLLTVPGLLEEILDEFRKTKQQLEEI